MSDSRNLDFKRAYERMFETCARQDELLAKQATQVTRLTEERDEWKSQAEAEAIVSTDARRERDALQARLCETEQSYETVRARLHDTAHILVDRVGAPHGSENADSVARRAVEHIDALQEKLDDCERLKTAYFEDRIKLSEEVDALQERLGNSDARIVELREQLNVYEAEPSFQNYNEAIRKQRAMSLAATQKVSEAYVRVNKAFAELSAAVTQTIPSDDQIVAHHTRNALTLVEVALTYLGEPTPPKGDE